jgi:uncharacterized membrane protein
MFDAFPSFNDVLKSFEDPQRLHAIVVHAPIALAVLGLLLTIAVTLTGSRWAGLRWTTIFIFTLGALAAAAANYTGEESESHLPGKISDTAVKMLSNHKQLAQWFWVALASTGFLLLLSCVRATWFRSITLVLALLTSIASVGWVASIAHYGGEMVYRESVGVPSSGPIPHSSATTRDGEKKDKATKDETTKDESTKDGIEPSKDKVEPPIKDAPVKDNGKIKDKADEKDKGERKLPEPANKDKSIFDP